MRKIILSNKQKEVIRLMRQDETLRIRLEIGIHSTALLVSKKSVGDYPITAPTAFKLLELKLVESDGTEKRQSEMNLKLSKLGKTFDFEQNYLYRI